MKRSGIILLLSVSLVSCIQALPKPAFEKENLDWTDVDYVEISDKYRLTEQQAKQFINKWNRSEEYGMVKCAPRFFIRVHLNDGTIRNYRICKSLVKENNDFAYKIDDSLFFDAIWNELDKDPIKNIRAVFEEYIQYDESTDSEENKGLMKNGLKTLSKVSDPEDLELLLNVWMYYDPTDFPVRELVEEVLFINQSESIEAITTRQENKKEWESDNKAPFSELNYLLSKLEK